MVTELKFSGLGGQGVILAAMIVGKAAALFDHKHATLTQSFGPEARGSACSAQVVVSTERILYPYVVRPQCLMALSQDAYGRFGRELAPGGILLVEDDLVQVDGTVDARVYKVPATRLAEGLGRRLVLNIVMVGVFAAVADVVTPEALRKAVANSVPEKTIELNLRAFDLGFEHGRRLAPS
jgi:2-oxoglutarate ferredoxin oxidoreductase subunit gamma